MGVSPMGGEAAIAVCGVLPQTCGSLRSPPIGKMPMLQSGPTMKIIVTGGAGFLGAKITKLLVDAGHEVAVFSRKATGNIPDGATAIDGNLCDADAVSDALEDTETVFHVAAKAGGWGKRKDFFGVNLYGTRNVIKACKLHGVKNLIYTSTPSVVFGSKPLDGADESTPYASRFLTYYAESKAMAEEETLEASGKGVLKTCALRPHLIWGNGDPHLVPRVLARAKSGKLRQVGDGQNEVDITHVNDAAQAHIMALENMEQAASKAYFISSEKVNLWDWINTLLEKHDLPRIEKAISRSAAYKIGAIMEAIWRALMLNSEPPMTRFVAENLATSHWFDTSRAAQDLGFTPQWTGEKAFDELLGVASASCR
ncbi:MAG: NAD-dependent epimerase/dehydratase family protein [Planctomycetes bacterium]|nr:NAD-dependent epimerase/dehydratase family protein [Planctomycetota bacterium]